MNRFLLILVIFICVVLHCHGQINTTDSLFQEFKTDIEIEQRENQGLVIWDNETRITFYLLMQSATTESLVKYANDPNPAVRCEIFLGLAQKNANDEILTEILKNQELDTAKFPSKSADLISSLSPKEYMQLIINWKNNNLLRKINYAQEIENLKKETLLIIPGVDHNLIKKDSLLAMNTLQSARQEIEILSFSVTIGNKTTKSKGTAFTKRMKRIIANAQPGDKIFFCDIKGENQDNKVRQLGIIELKIQ